MKKHQFSNPFYFLLVILGVTFGMTACAYGVMAVKMSTAAGVASNTESPLIDFLNAHGLTVLLVELVLLGVTTVAAIGTDGYWTKNK